jgi:hypothetical protein
LIYIILVVPGIGKQECMENGPESGLLMLRCVATGRPVHTGVWFDKNELAAVRSKTIKQMHCPLCGDGHGFMFSDAWIEKPG